MFKRAERKPGPRKFSKKLVTSDLVSAVSEQTGLRHRDVTDVIFALLHYIRYATLMTGQRIVLRNAGSFHAKKVWGRVYSQHVDAPRYHPDRMALRYTTALTEVDLCKNMRLIQQNVATALGAEPERFDMDQAVCARIAGLVLSSNPVGTLTETEQENFIRQWVYATGAPPLLATDITRTDHAGQTFRIQPFRLCRETRNAIIFNYVPDSLFLPVVVKTRWDVVFLPQSWIPASRIARFRSRKGLASAPSPDDEDFSTTQPENIEVPYGETVEDQAASLFLAYLYTKYGEVRGRAQDKAKADKKREGG